MIQILASYIILKQNYTFRCFLLEFRHFKCFAYDHSRHQPLGRNKNGKMVSLQLNSHKGVPAGHVVEVQQEAGWT